MKFGVFFLLEQPEWTTQARVYADVLAQAAYAEALGYDSVWLAEHHFSEYGICPSMAVLMGALAERTRRGRPRTPRTIPPFNHPLRPPQEGALGDQPSAGPLAF